MNKTLRILAVSLLGISPLLMSSCESDDPKDTCKSALEDFGTCSVDDITVCSDNELNTYFIYKGDRKNQDELDAICLPSSATFQERQSAKMKLDALSEQLLFEVKLDAMCN